MNLRSLINFNESLNTAIGINVHTTDSLWIKFSYCIIKKENDLLTVVESEANIDTVEMLHEKLKPYSKSNVRTHINFSGKGVLIKPLENNAVANDSTSVQKLFPFIRNDEVVTQWHISNAASFLAVARNDMFNVLNTLDELGYSFFSASLGPFILNAILPLLEEAYLHINGYRIDLNINGITNVSGAEVNAPKSKNSFQVADQEIASEVLLAYASACTIFLPTASITTSTLSSIEKGKEYFQFNSRLYKVAKIAMIVTLFFLLINTGIFFWLQSEASHLESQVLSAHGKSKEEEVMQTKLVELTHSYKRLGWKSNLLPLYYSDQIAQTLPKGIQLVVLEVGALDEERVRQERTISFLPDVIKIKGLSDNPLLLNQWVKMIEGLDWVNDTSDQRYQYDARKGKGLFELNIHIK
jgi:hypothetical protein